MGSKLNIDKYLVDGNYIDEDGCHHDTAIDFIQCHIFKFCGCGRPEENLKYVCEALDIIAERSDITGNYEEKCAKSHQRAKELYKTDAAEYFMWYWLETVGLTEHGGSVPGWLTGEGWDVLADLKELKERNEI